MFGIQRFHIKSFELGLVFKRGEFERVLLPGKHWLLDVPGNTEVEVFDQREIHFYHDQLDVIVKSQKMDDFLTVIDLQDNERAILFENGRFVHILHSGLHAFFKGFNDVQVEIRTIEEGRFLHPKFNTIVNPSAVGYVFHVYEIKRNHVGVLYTDGKFAEILQPGKHAFWMGDKKYSMVEMDLRETSRDVAGQELMTKDKVTLRLNALVNYKVVDPRKAIELCDDIHQALYREVQLALRATIGTYMLDTFLTEKDEIADAIQADLEKFAKSVGLEISSIGIRDIILPGEMKDLMNKVTEAKKVAEANLISRREETAAIRSQANTAKLLSENPALMRLRELEVLEKVSANSSLSVILGDKGLAESVTKLL